MLRKTCVALCISFLLFFVPSSYADVPETVSFSGVLSSEGALVVGSHDVTTRVVDSNDVVLWTQTHEDVQFSNGKFTLYIGQDAETPLSIDIIEQADKVLMDVNDETVFLNFSSAFFTRFAEKAATANVALRSLTTDSVDWADVTQKPSGFVTANVSGIQSGHLLQWDGSDWVAGDYNISSTGIVDNAVTSEKIDDETIRNIDISTTAGISFSKLDIDAADITGLGFSTTDNDTTYTAGTGLELSGTEFTIQSSVVTNNYDGTITANFFSGNGSLLTNITADTIADDAVSTIKIQNDAITSIKIDDGTITDDDIHASASIDFSKLSIDTADITGLGFSTTDNDTTYTAGTGLDLSGTEFTIESSVVTNNYNGTITANLFSGNGSLLTNIFADTIADDAVTSAKIDDGSITNDDINGSASIDFSKLSIDTADITGLGFSTTDNDTTYTAGTGLDLSGTEFAIQSSVVTNNYDGTITANFFDGNGSLLTNVVASDIANDAVTSAKIDDGTITNDDINGSASIAFSKLSIDTADITGLGFSTTDNDTTYTAGTGLDLSGTEFTIEPSVVTNSYNGTITANFFSGNGSLLTNISADTIADDAVTSVKIDDGTITNDDINGSASIDFSKLSIDTADITGLGFSTTDNDTTYTAGTGLDLSGTEFAIEPSVVTNSYNGTITANFFDGNGSLLTNVVASDIANDAVTSAKIDDGTITNDDINGSASIAFSKLSIDTADITGLGFSTTDNDTTYTAGTGLDLSGTEFSIEPSVVTNSYNGTITANFFDGNGSLLTNVVASDIANDVVTSAKIDDGTITNDDINGSASIAFSKLSIDIADITGLGFSTTDNDTTYTAGTGLDLSGTEFAVDSSVVTSNYSGIVTATSFVASSITVNGTITVNNIVPNGTSVFVGLDAGASDDGSANHNVYVGDEAGENGTTADSNVYIGSDAGKGTTSGSNNIFIGRDTGEGNQTGSNNTFVGNNSGSLLSAGSGNVFIGNEAGASETGSNRLYIDNSSTGAPLIEGDFSTNAVTINGTLESTGELVAASALVNGTITVNNIVINGTSVFVGSDAGFNDDGSANHNVYVGDEAGENGTTADSNVYIGSDAGKGTTSGSNNIFIGRDTGEGNQTGSNNTFVGNNSGGLLSAGSGNVFIGNEAGASETGSNRLYIDNSSTGAPLIEGDFSTNAVTINGTLESTGELVAASALVNGTITVNNIIINGTSVFVGSDAGASDDGSANHNVYVGDEAGENGTTADSNVYIGSDAGKGTTSGSNNIFIGRDTGEGNQTGSNNTFVGNNSGGLLSAGSGNVFIGNEAGASETGSNRLYIDNSSTGAPLIEGDFSTNAVTINGTLESTGQLVAQSALVSTTITANAFAGDGSAITNIAYDNVTPDSWTSGSMSVGGSPTYATRRYKYNSTNQISFELSFTATSNTSGQIILTGLPELPSNETVFLAYVYDTVGLTTTVEPFINSSGGLGAFTLSGLSVSTSYEVRMNVQYGY